MFLQPRPAPASLSLVIPCYNEEHVLPLLRRELEHFVPTLGLPTEIVLVDDGSSDRTLPALLEWAHADPRAKIVVLARNFGHQNAATAGLEAASGDAVVLLDADLQDPLEVIVQMIEKYREGYDVVYGRRLSRSGESGFKRLSAWFFYRLMKTFVHRDLPPDAGDFRLVSRPCLDAVLSMREVHRFLRGMIAWVGFLQTSVSFHRAPRAAGTSKYSLWKMLRFASHAILSFTPLPLRISLVFGFIVAAAALLYGLWVVYGTLVYRDTVPGWTTQVVITSFLGGAILISNGILGEYIGRCFEELKQRPLYVVAQRINFGPDPRPAAR